MDRVLSRVPRLVRVFEARRAFFPSRRRRLTQRVETDEGSVILSPDGGTRRNQTDGAFPPCTRPKRHSPRPPALV